MNRRCLVKVADRFLLIYGGLLILGMLLPASSCLGAQDGQTQQPVPVKLLKQGDRWQLLRDGKPYFVKGGGGMGDLKLLKKCGANSTRIWGIDETTLQRLDEAHQHGLTVALGLWIEHERHGFQYTDQAAVQKQFDDTLAAVKRFKDHPAVLVWGIGNEMEGAGANPRIWKHLEQLSSAIKSIDPNHPTMTVIAELGDTKVACVHHYCPSIDIIGINSYGGADSVSARYQEQGGVKPYLITEFGPPGAWEVAKNSIGAVIEETSTAKAAFYSKAYDTFAADKNFCLGSYGFLFGHKQEATATWFGLLLPDGNRTEGLDVLTERWSGNVVPNLCPRIDALNLESSLEVKPDSIVKLELKVRDPENDPLTASWVLMEEAETYVTGGDFQKTPASFPENIVTGDENGATVKLPQHDGIFRIYAFVNDGHGGGACANQSIRVRGVKLAPGEKAQLPLVIYDEPSEPGSYAPSGWMGNSAQVKMNPDHPDGAKQGSHCLECKYVSPDGWAGVVWQHPADDWGDKSGGFDVSGAKELVFWAKGEQGGEEIKFGYGLLGAEKRFPDSSSKESVVRLTNQWTRYSIELSGKDLSRVKTGFYWVVSGQGKPLTFYLDAIGYN